MSDHEQQHQPIIKKIKKSHKHHGGSWKIAYADFVTAMMAFFLLMWLLSMLNKYQLQGVAEYFKDPAAEPKMMQTNEKPKQKIVQKVFPISAEDQIKQLKKIKADLENKVNKDPTLSQYKNQLNFIITSDGLKIVLKDLENKPMFSKGDINFEDYAEKIVGWLSNELNAYPNRVMVIGHTDSYQYNNDGSYTNWELSADRANATRRVLVNHGMSPDKVIRVVGMADTDTLDNKTKLDPSNRRIEIIILTDQAAKKILQE